MDTTRNPSYVAGILMIRTDEKKYILENAYIPEHLVGLMTLVSGGEPYLIEDYFCCRKEDWTILVGYPLQSNFIIREFENLIDKIRKRFRPRYLSLIGPEIPPSLGAHCEERESDNYYTLDIPITSTKNRLRRLVNKALENLTVVRSTQMEEAHRGLIDEFIQRAHPSPRVANLFLKMPDYVDHSDNAVVLNAWDRENNLAAFYVVDVAAKDFSAYVMGCHSKKTYVPGASDLLCHCMIEMSLEREKRYVHLGLGVNEGIQRFKRKWGGVPSRRYEMCELVLRKPSILSAFSFAKRTSPRGNLPAQS